MTRRHDFHELGDAISSRWGYTVDDGDDGDLLEGKTSAGVGPTRNDTRVLFLLSAVVKHLRSQVSEARALRRELASLGKKVADGIAAGEERKARAVEKATAAMEKAAIAERDAKLEVRPVVVIQCPNEVIDMIPLSRLRGRW